MKHYIALFATCLAVICAGRDADAATLSDPLRTENQFQFTLTGESNAIYIIESSTNLQHWQSVLTNRQLAIARTISVTVPDAKRYYRARLGRTFTFALAASDFISLLGNNIAIDSFNSADPNESTNGRYDPLKARDHGDVGAYRGLTNSNARIYGVLWTGPGGSARIGPQGVVGSRAYVDDPANAGTIEPGHFTDNMNAQFASVTPPTGTFLTPVPGVYNGSPFTYVLGANALYMINGDLNLNNSALVVTNHVTLWVTRNISLGGSAKIIIAPGARLTLYGGHSGVLAGTSTTFAGGSVSNLHALAFQYYGLPSNTNVVITGDSDFAGVVYAPNAGLSLDGGGSIADFFGSAIVKNVVVYGNFRFHYDEHLARVGPAF